MHPSHYLLGKYKLYELNWNCVVWYEATKIYGLKMGATQQDAY